MPLIYPEQVSYKRWRCEKCRKWAQYYPDAPALASVWRHRCEIGVNVSDDAPHLPETPDMVNSPPHYGGEGNVYEHYKVCRAWGLVGNAFLYNCTKYICRMGKKGNPLTALEDLRKAQWYLSKAIEDLEK